MHRYKDGPQLRKLSVGEGSVFSCDGTCMHMLHSSGKFKGYIDQNFIHYKFYPEQLSIGLMQQVILTICIRIATT